MRLNTSVLNKGLIGGASNTVHAASAHGNISGTLVHDISRGVLITHATANAVASLSSHITPLVRVNLVANPSATGTFVTDPYQIHAGKVTAKGSLKADITAQVIYHTEAHGQYEFRLEPELVHIQSVQAQGNIKIAGQAFIEQIVYAAAEGTITGDYYALIQGHMGSAAGSIEGTVNADATYIHNTETTTSNLLRVIGLPQADAIRTTVTHMVGSIKGTVQPAYKYLDTDFFTHESYVDMKGAVDLKADALIIKLGSAEIKGTFNATAKTAYRHNSKAVLKGTVKAELGNQIHLVTAVELAMEAKVTGYANAAKVHYEQIQFKGAVTGLIKRTHQRHSGKASMHVGLTGEGTAKHFNALYPKSRIEVTGEANAAYGYVGKAQLSGSLTGHATAVQRHIAQASMHGQGIGVFEAWTNVFSNDPVYRSMERPYVDRTMYRPFTDREMVRDKAPETLYTRI